MIIRKSWKLKLAIGLGVVCLPAAASAQVCSGFFLTNPAFQMTHHASEVCSSSDANVGAITYNALGWVYNNSTTTTRNVACAMPNILGRPASKVAAIVVIDPKNSASPKTTCTLRVWTGDASVVYSNTGTSPCSQSLVVEDLGQLSVTASVRCALPKKGSIVPSITRITEGTF